MAEQDEKAGEKERGRQRQKRMTKAKKKRKRKRYADAAVGEISRSKKTVMRSTGINKRATLERRTEDVNACVHRGGVRLISSATRRWADGSPVRAS